MRLTSAAECQAFELNCAVDLVVARPLGQMRPGSAGRIVAVSGDDRDIERGLLEMGFVEGARIEVLHHGWLRRDPMAVRINHTMTVALRRCEANAVLVGPPLDRAAEPALQLGEPLPS